MSNYNLSDNVNDTFNFEIRNLKFTMRYPLTDEIESVQEITSQVREAEEANRNDEVKELTQKLESILYGFITPQGHETDIKEALKKENIRVMRNFNTMIKTELSIQ